MIYTDGKEIPREVMLKFLQEVNFKMREIQTAEDLVQQWMNDREKIGSPGLHLVCMEFQRDELEYTYGIERNFGSRYLGMIPMNHPEDVELNENASQFVLNSMHLYVAALKTRYKMRGGELRKSRKMTSLEMSEFFEGCNALMALDDTKVKLKQIFLDTLKPPNEEIIKMQRSVLNWIGVDADFGVDCLNNLQRDYPDDRELAGKVQQFAMCAQVHCQIACMNDEEKEQFYKPIPTFMKQVPHLYVMQQQHAQQREMMRRQQELQAQGGHDHGHMHGHHGQHPDPSMMAKVQEVMSNPETRQQMENLSQRMASIGTAVGSKIKEMSSEDKKKYLDEAQSDPLITKLNSCGQDILKRLETFKTLSDEDVDRMMTLQALMLEVMPQRAAGMMQGGANSSSGSGGGIMGSLSNFFSGLTMGGGVNGHSHGHHHAQRPVSQQPSLSSGSYTPDVTSGKSDTMDR